MAEVAVLESSARSAYRSDALAHFYTVELLFRSTVTDPKRLKKRLQMRHCHRAFLHLTESVKFERSPVRGGAILP
jgi:hypothetical protein